jgi:hypothetical protein
MTLKRAFLIILLAFMWLIAAVVALSVGIEMGVLDRRPSGVLEYIIPIVVFGGFLVLLLAGFCVWAGAKGYNPLWGVLLGWLGPFGMLILVFLADRSAERRNQDRTGGCA